MKQKIAKYLMLAVTMGMVATLALGGLTGCGSKNAGTQDTKSQSTAAESTEKTKDIDLKQWNPEKWASATEDEKKAAVEAYIKAVNTKQGQPDKETTADEFNMTYDVVKTVFEQDKELMKDTTLQSMVDEGVAEK
ncbi:hypothetical protein [Eubacterium sp.]|uniref:hypothetical protein n=1 Tax=Eubacterium sp. TaxID=142586 RepID=UPI0026E0D2BD|nr:hypothetical protein [Eubacterium sp.]MDO5433499.1 hypothetical protein [Eubacterium sp.]